MFDCGFVDRIICWRIIEPWFHYRLWLFSALRKS